MADFCWSSFFFNLLSYHNKLMVTILTFDRFQNCFQHLCYALTIGGKRRLFGKLLSWFVGHCLNKRPWNTIWMATSTTYVLIEKKNYTCNIKSSYTAIVLSKYYITRSFLVLSWVALPSGVSLIFFFNQTILRMITVLVMTTSLWTTHCGKII